MDDIAVSTLPAPVVQSVAVSPGGVNLAWSSLSNLTYQVQATTNRAIINWTNLGGTITATNNLTRVSEPIGAASGQFYRVVLLPGP